MSFLKGYENQKRIIYLIMFIVVAYPILRPLGLPIGITQYTRDYYNTIETLPAGSVVLVHYGGDAASWGELEPQVIATVQHVFNRPLKIIFCSTWAMGSPFIDQAINRVNRGSKQYGVDYVHIGYIPGWETGVAALANNLHGIVNVDYYGHSIAGTFLDSVSTGRDVALVVAFECGSAGSSTFLTQYQVPFGTKVVAGSIGVIVPGTLPYYQSGQISGILASVRGAAEYELLTKNPGKGVIGTDVLSFAHLWVIAAVLIGNIVYFIEKGGKK
jgi:hypothetical protein